MPLFNIRVYGIMINNRKEILLSEEQYADLHMTKFPGGGLEYGEGTLECLQRECMEEAGITVEIMQHYYTTDHFQKSFVNEQQIISIYYTLKPLHFYASALKTPEGKYVYYPINYDLIDKITMPIDKKVMCKIIKDIEEGKL